LQVIEIYSHQLLK